MYMHACSYELKNNIISKFMAWRGLGVERENKYDKKY